MRALMGKLFFQGTTTDFLIDAFCLLNVALFIGPSYHPAIVALIVLGFGMLFCSPFRVFRNIRIPHFRAFVLFVFPLLSLAKSPSAQLPIEYLWVYRTFSIAAFVAAIGFYCATERLRKWIVFALCAGKFCLVVGATICVPRPEIDLWQLQQHAVDFLVKGQNPYTMPVPDIYEGGSAQGHQAHYAYAPLNLLFSIAPKVLLGDYRHGLTACLLVGLLLFRRAGKSASVSPFHLDFLTLLFVLQPRLEHWIVYGWMEPYMLPFLAGSVILVLRNPQGTFPMLLFFSLPMFKQYVAVPILLYVFFFRPKRSAFLWAGLLALLAAIPIFVLKLHGHLYNALLYFVRFVQFREDALGLSVPLFKLTGFRCGSAVSLFAQFTFGTLFVIVVGKRGTVEGRFLLAMAGTLWGAFLFSPQAFENYYFFVLFVLLLGILLFEKAKDLPDVPQPETLGPPLKRAASVLSLASFLVLMFHSLYYHFLCPFKETVGREKVASGRPLLDSGFDAAKETEQIFVCNMKHCFGTLCHEDLRCLCVEREVFPTPELLEKHMTAQTSGVAHCRLDQALPKLTNQTGLCQRARCTNRYSVRGLKQ